MTTDTPRAQKCKDLLGEFGHRGARSLENIDRLGVLCQLHGCVARLKVHMNTRVCVCVCLCVCVCTYIYIYIHIYYIVTDIVFAHI